MGAAAARGCLLAVGLLSSLLQLAGGCQLVCGLYLLLKAPQPAVNGATITAGVWDVLVGLVTVTLCFTGPLRASRRSQLQLAALCSAPVVNAVLAVVIALVPRTEQPPAINTVCFISGVSTAVAGGASFIAANLVFCMQLLFDRYRPGTQAWSSPKSVSSGASSFLFSQAQMTQKPGTPDLWLTNGVPLASWVYRTQSTTNAPQSETRLDAPPADPCATTEFRADGPRAVPPPQRPQRPQRNSSSDSSLVLRTAPAAAFRASDVPTPSSADGGALATRMPRCLSLLSAVYGHSRGGWPPTERQLRSFSLLEVRPPPTGVSDRPVSSDTLLLGRPLAAAVAVDEASEPGSPAPFPPAPVPLCASPLPTPMSERPPGRPPGTPLAGTIGRLASALSRLHSDPDYRASRELEEALQALQALELTPVAQLTSTLRPGPERPASAASHASSGYGSPDGSKEGEPPPPGNVDYQRRSVVQLVTLLEQEPGPATRRTDSVLQRPSVPPPPPPTDVSPPADAGAALKPIRQSVSEPSPEIMPKSRPNRPVESEC